MHMAQPSQTSLLLIEPAAVPWRIRALRTSELVISPRRIGVGSGAVCNFTSSTRTTRDSAASLRLHTPVSHIGGHVACITGVSATTTHQNTQTWGSQSDPVRHAIVRPVKQARAGARTSQSGRQRVKKALRMPQLWGIIGFVLVLQLAVMVGAVALTRQPDPFE